MRQNIFGGLLRGVTLDQISFDVNVEALGAARTLTANDATLQVLDANGAARVITLPAEASSRGKMFVIVNTGIATEDLDVQDDGATTVATIIGAAAGSKEMAILVCDGVTWYSLVGTST